MAASRGLALHRFDRDLRLTGSVLLAKVSFGMRATMTRKPGGSLFLGYNVLIDQISRGMLRISLPSGRRVRIGSR